MNKEVEILKMPKWGMTMTEGTVVSWLKEEGDSLQTGEEIVEIETDKITNVIESERTTYLRKIIVPAGKTVKCGDPLAIVSNEILSVEEISSMIESDSSKSNVLEDLSQESYIEIENLSIRVMTRLTETDNLPVILLHGFGADASSWQLVESHLVDKYSLHTIELPCHGGSSISFKHTSVEALTSVLSKAVSTLAPEGCHLVGHSLGGMLAITLAKTLVPLIRSVTLIAPAGVGQEINKDFLKTFVSAKKRREMKQALALLVENSNLITSNMVEKALMVGRIDGASEALTKMSEDMLEQIEGRTVARSLKNLNCSVKIIWGERDLIIPVAVPDCEIIDGAGHMPHLESPKIVNEMIEKHLRENS
mgnify:CR=1 FL=1